MGVDFVLYIKNILVGSGCASVVVSSREATTANYPAPLPYKSYQMHRIVPDMPVEYQIIDFCFR